MLTNILAKDDPITARSAVRRVFNTTELIEMVLLQDIIPFHQRFSLQRVSKGLRDVIEGSQQLKLKMFLIYDTKEPYPKTREVPNRLLKGDGAPLFNPLMGILPALNKELVQMPIFRHFDFQLLREMREHSHIYLLSSKPLAGIVEKKLKPHLGGSWKKLKICRVPTTLRFCLKSRHLGAPGTPALSLTGEDVTIGDLVEWLSAWYSRERRENPSYYELMYTKLWLDVCFD